MSLPLYSPPNGSRPSNDTGMASSHSSFDMFEPETTTRLSSSVVTSR